MSDNNRNLKTSSKFHVFNQRRFLPDIKLQIKSCLVVAAIVAYY